MTRVWWLLLAVLAPAACPSAEIGDPVPECAAATASEHLTAGLAGPRGRVLLVDFWATWCPPCRKSMPFLNSLRNELRDQGFEVVAVNVDEDSDEATRYLAAHPVDYPVLFDPKGSCPSAFAIKAMPSSYFVGRDGRIRGVHAGFREGDQGAIRQQATSLLAE